MPRWQASESDTTRGGCERVRAAGAFPACGAARDGRHVRDIVGGSPPRAGRQGVKRGPAALDTTY